MTTHTTVRKGKRVIVTLRDGTMFTDKFVARVGKGINLEQHGLILGRNLRAMTIYRGQSVSAHK